MFKFYKQHEGFILGVLGVLFFIILWSLLTSFTNINPVLISSPKNVAYELFWFFKTGFIYEHIISSISEFFVGFILAVIFGVTVALVLGWVKKINYVFKPLIYALYATPIIAIFPLIIIWFGVDFWSKVVFVFLASFFPILINTIDAVRNIDQNYLRLARSFVAPDFKIITTIVLPNAIPYITSGIRIAIPRGIIGMVIAEFFTGSVGLGYLISYYGATFQTARLLGAVLLLVFLSISLRAVIDLLEKKIKIWKL